MHIILSDTRLALIWMSFIDIFSSLHCWPTICSNPKTTPDHWRPWQHHSCHSGDGHHALCCPWLPSSHGAMVQRRLPPDKLLNLFQPSQQWTAAHIQVRLREYSYFLFLHCCWYFWKVHFNEDPSFGGFWFKVKYNPVWFLIDLLWKCYLSVMWQRRTKAGITVRPSTRMK